MSCTLPALVAFAIFFSLYLLLLLLVSMLIYFVAVELLDTDGTLFVPLLAFLTFFC